MAERTTEEIATIFEHAGHSVNVINTLAALSLLSTEQKAEIERNVQHLEIIKGYKKESDGTTSIWTTEDFTEQDAAVTLGKTKYE